jgi:hypothetical protein
LSDRGDGGVMPLLDVFQTPSESCIMVNYLRGPFYHI